MTALAVTAASFGYLTAGPTVRVVASPDGRSLVRIDPATQRQSGKPAQCTATVFQFDDEVRVYRQLTTFPLRNPSAPDQVLIANNAEYIVTFDDWDPAIGRGPNVLVVYRGTGEFLKAWTLEELLTPDELAALEPPTGVLGPWPRRWRSDIIQMLHGPKGAYVNIP